MWVRRFIYMSSQLQAWRAVFSKHFYITFIPVAASLYQLTRALRNGSIDAQSLANTCFDNIASTARNLNAYRVVTNEIGLRAAQAADATLAATADPGALCGIPISIKDLYGVNGLDVFAGSPRAVPERWQRQGPLIDLARNQLAVITGKTHTVEFAFGGLGVNSHWETPVNPWDNAHHRVPGGSSSGAGVSIISGCALIAFGTDTAGSVRLPASMTGTVGLKTTFGRWSTDGVFPLSPSLDSAGILTRTVEDAAFAFAAIDPWVEQSPWQFIDELRSQYTHPPAIGTNEPALYENCEASIVRVIEDVVSRMEAHGATRISAPLPEAAMAQELLHKGNVVSAELSEFLASEMPDWLNTLDPLVGSRIADGGEISASDWLARKRLLNHLASNAATRFDECDVMASATCAISPPRLDEVSVVEDYRRANLAALDNTCVANSLGLCAITLPVGLDHNGMPVGLQLMAPGGFEETLLATALWIEDRIGSAVERIGEPPAVSKNAKE